MLEQLKERVNKELEDFKTEWLEKPTEELFYNAYKLSIVQDFEYLPFDVMDFEQIETLMAQENIIDFLFEEWMESNGFDTFGVLDEFFRYVVNDRI